MPDRRFDPDTAEILTVCQEFRIKELEPCALELDSHYDAERVRTLWQKSLGPGIPALLIPEEKGGVGLSPLTAALVLDELAYGCAGFATLLAHHLAASLALMEGTQPFQAELLTRLGADDTNLVPLITLAYPDSEAREDWPQIKKIAGVDLLSGMVPIVACAPLSDFILIFAREDGSAGVSALVIDTQAEGVRVCEREQMLGLHTVPFARVILDQHVVNEGNRLGEPGEASDLMRKTMAAFYGFIAAISMGAARSSQIKAYEYASQRYQFGKMIIEHQELQRFLANMMVKTNMGTAGYIQAFIGSELGSLATVGKAEFAKIFCTDVALEAVIDAIQIHGGIGYMKDTGLEKILRDTKMLQVLGKGNRFIEIDTIGELLQSEEVSHGALVR